MLWGFDQKSLLEKVHLKRLGSSSVDRSRREECCNATAESCTGAHELASRHAILAHGRYAVTGAGANILANFVRDWTRYIHVDHQKSCIFRRLGL